MRRRLSEDDLLAILDILEDRADIMTTDDKDRLTKSCISEKVSYAAMYFLLTWSPSGNNQETEESESQE